MFSLWKKGHFKKECKFYKKLKMVANLRQKSANVVEYTLPNNAKIIATVGGLTINMITKCNSTNSQSFDRWYDSGAAVHICNNEDQFNNYQVGDQQEIVLMENNNTNVLGKGTIELEFTFGKTLVLTNVYHIPNTRKNMVSTSAVCSKGLKVLIEAEKVILSKK